MGVKTRIGLLGSGGVARVHFELLGQVPGAQLVPFTDPVERGQLDSVRTDVASLEWQTPAWHVPAGWWDSVAAVWISAPPRVQPGLAIAAARAGKHVFIEVPIAHSVEAADAIITACRGAGVRLMVGHFTRFVPQARRLHALIQAGHLGELVACWSRRLVDLDITRLPGWALDSRQGGGYLLRLGVHELDLLRWMVEASGARVARVSGGVSFGHPVHSYLDTYARGTLYCSSGVVGGFDGGMDAPLGGGISRAVVGTHAMAVLEDNTLRVRRVRETVDELVPGMEDGGQPQKWGANLLASAEEFLAAIAEDREPAVSGMDGRAALALGLAIHQASREGKDVTV